MRGMMRVRLSGAGGSAVVLGHVEPRRQATTDLYSVDGCVKCPSQTREARVYQPVFVVMGWGC